MPYTTPSTQGASSVIPTSRLNSYKAGLDWLATDKPRCRLRSTTNVSIPNSSATAVGMDSERFDVGGMHAGTSSKIIIPSGGGGLYLLGAGGSWASNATGYRQLAIRLNGATLLVITSGPPRSDGFSIQSLTTTYVLAAGDEIELVAEQNSGGALNLLAASAYSPELWACWVATT